MAMNSKQRLLGGIVLLGGSVLFAAILLQNNKHESSKTTSESNATHGNTAAPVQPAEIDLQPLSVDVETEKKLLEEQRKAREQAVAEQERRAAEYLATQQQAEAAAAKKAAAEQAAILARRQSQMQSSDNIPPELVQEGKPATANSDQAKRDADLKAQQAKADAAAKAKRDADLKAQQAKADAAAKAKRDAAKAQQAKADAAAKAKRDAEAKTQKAKSDETAKAKAEDAARARDILENGDKKWMVQVALAATQYNADSMTAKLRARGYQVTQSPTSKGIRIMVGPAKSRDSAESMRKKITTDSSLNMKSAWVIGWVPLDQR